MARHSGTYTTITPSYALLCVAFGALAAAAYVVADPGSMPALAVAQCAHYHSDFDERRALVPADSADDWTHPQAVDIPQLGGRCHL
ncbi:hypothetical protein ACRCUN_00560 [Mycobacterium sp. LTG2003]